MAYQYQSGSVISGGSISMAYRASWRKSVAKMYSSVSVKKKKRRSTYRQHQHQHGRIIEK